MSNITIYRFTPHCPLQKEEVGLYMYMFFHFQESNTLQYFLFEPVAYRGSNWFVWTIPSNLNSLPSTEDFIFWIGSIFNLIFVFFKTCNLRILKTVHTFVHFLFFIFQIKYPSSSYSYLLMVHTYKKHMLMFYNEYLLALKYTVFTVKMVFRW